jgi:hypothetical protein
MRHCTAAREYHIQVQRGLQKELHLHSYNICVVEELKASDKTKHIIVGGLLDSLRHVVWMF